jgi:serine phosphatase RsbU (regulator of sigma subunit)
VVEPLQVTGSLMGIFATSFPLATLQLQPGDKVLFFSDGVDSASSSAVDGPGPDGLARCARRLHGLPIDELVERLPIEMFGEAGPGDDFTLLGLEFDGAGQPPSDRQ